MYIRIAIVFKQKVNNFLTIFLVILPVLWIVRVVGDADTYELRITNDELRIEGGLRPRLIIFGLPWSSAPTKSKKSAEALFYNFYLYIYRYVYAEEGFVFVENRSDYFAEEVSGLLRRSADEILGL